MKITEKHPLWLRIVHWLNVPLLCLMIWSGILIYWANDIYPGFFPEKFYNLLGISSRLAEGLQIHFFMAWFFILNGLIYLIFLFRTGHWRELFPNLKTPGLILPTLLHDLGIRKEPLPVEKFNAVQRLAYTGAIILGLAGVLSGFAIYKPVQLSWLLAIFGGYRGARLVHFIVVISFCAFIFVHLVQVARAGWNNFRAMVAGFETEHALPEKLRRRSKISFALLFVFLIGFVSLWMTLRAQPLIDEAPGPFRQVLELNGTIWKTLFNSSRTSTCQAPPAGKIPRVNGVIGLDEEIDIEKWTLEVVGDDQDPNADHFTIGIEDLKRLPRTETSTEFKCIEGWSEEMGFAGVKFSDFMEFYHLKPKKYVGLQTSDGNYYVSIDLESMMHRQTLLAFEMNGEVLRPKNGAPLRLVIPVKYGIKNIKRIGKIFFSDQRPPDYWAEQGYDWYAGL